MYSNPLVLLVTLLLNLARPITCIGQSPTWVHKEQERQLFLPGTLMREEKEIGDLFHPVSCISVGQPAGMDHTQLLSADQSPGCWIPPGLSPRRESQGWQGLGLVHRYSGRKAGWKRGTAPSTWKTTSPSPGTRKYCTQPTQWTTLEPSLQQEKKKKLGLVFYQAWQ